MVKSRSKTRAIDGTRAFSLKIFDGDYEAVDKASKTSGIPKAIVFRLVFREAVKAGLVEKVAGSR